MALVSVHFRLKPSASRVSNILLQCVTYPVILFRSSLIYGGQTVEGLVLQLRHASIHRWCKHTTFPVSDPPLTVWISPCLLTFHIPLNPLCLCHTSFCVNPIIFDFRCYFLASVNFIPLSPCLHHILSPGKGTTFPGKGTTFPGKGTAFPVASMIVSVSVSITCTHNDNKCYKFPFPVIPAFPSVWVYTPSPVVVYLRWVR